MWNNLPQDEKTEYKRMILAYASLTRMFAQKAEEDSSTPTPIVNSKYQETVFSMVFKASVEDIGNTSYDASLVSNGKKYLIGLKTFGLKSGDQKIAQFKANHDEWTSILEKVKENSVYPDGTLKSKEEIDAVNKESYLWMAKRIAELRNTRIESAKSNLQGFVIRDDEEDVEAVYHVLMPSVSDDVPTISVGEISYDPINIDGIEILGCTSPKNPTNFSFTDGNHEYRFTSADSQLLMNFHNPEIVKEDWKVVYAEDPYGIFADIADKLYRQEVKQETSRKKEIVTDSFSWSLLNKNGEVELFSGFNSFFGVGSKLGRDTRKKRIDTFFDDFDYGIIDDNSIDYITDRLRTYLLDESPDKESKLEKVKIRDDLILTAKSTGNDYLVSKLEKLVYRPENELYIPLPNSRKVHMEHPYFFSSTPIEFNNKGRMLNEIGDRVFNLVFEPSGDTIESFIAEDWGKAIESTDSMGILGEWILRGVFQLKKYEPLTAKRLNDVGINGIRLYKLQDSNDVHLQFIWIDEDNIPSDFLD